MSRKKIEHTFPIRTSQRANNTHACSFTSIPYSINCELTLKKDKGIHDHKLPPFSCTYSVWVNYQVLL